jgi:hypothetical protein
MSNNCDEGEFGGLMFVVIAWALGSLLLGLLLKLLG